MTEYCTLAELADLGLNPSAFVDVLAPRKHQAIQSRSAFIDGFLRNRFTLPLLAQDPISHVDIRSQDIVMCCARLVSVDLIRNRGVSPDDSMVLDAEEKRWTAWLTSVANGLITPQVTDSSTGGAPGLTGLAPRVVSASSRGFSVRGTGLPRGPFQSD